MKYRQLGGTGFEVSTVSLGTWAMGGAVWGKVDDRDSIKAVHRALDLGVNLFDTAPIYGNGRAEEVLGRALGPIRQDVFVATKCGPVPVRPGMIRMDLSPDGLVDQCDESLRRLHTDYIDLLQVHWNDAAYPVQKTMEGLRRLVKAGKVRAVGVSNFDLDDLTLAADAGDLASLQSRYNLICRELESGILPLCRHHKVGFLSYEPLGRGLLTGKFESPRPFEPGDIRRQDPRFEGEVFENHIRVGKGLSNLAWRQGITAAQLAVGWNLRDPVVTTSICGAKTAAQIVECAKASDMDLDPDTLEEAGEIARSVARMAEQATVDSP